MTEIKTKRLIIMPMTEEELNSLINQHKNTELGIAYQEMLDNCIKYTKQYIWYISWKICLAESNEEVGYAGFKGYNEGVPEIGYGINEQYQGNGYATEAVYALCKWALEQKGVIAVEAEIEYDNIISRTVLEKNGFIKTGTIGEEGPRYILKP